MTMRRTARTCKPAWVALLGLLIAPPTVSAELYACPTIDRDVYTESPSQLECRLMPIQPPALVYERANYGTGVIAIPEGPWPAGPAEAQAEICGLYREWVRLGRKRYEGLVLYPPQGLTPAELNRLYNLDLLFSHRGRPHCRP